MPNGKVFYNNILTPANIANNLLTLSVTTETPTYEKKFLYDNHPGTLYRTTAITTQYITFSFTTPTSIKGIAILNHNLLTGDTFTFEASSTSNFSSPVSQVIDPLKGWVEISWNYQYYRIKMSKSTGSYIQVGEIYLFTGAYEFENNFNWNYTKTKEIVRKSSLSTSGQTYRKTSYIRYGFNLSLTLLSDTQQQLFETIGESDYVVLFPYGTTGQKYYGCLDFGPFTHTSPNCWAVNAVFTENPK
jgi:hypothetical protein